MAFLQPPPTLTVAPPHPRPINSAGLVEGDKISRPKLKHRISRAISNESFPPLVVKKEDSDSDTFDKQADSAKSRYTTLSYLNLPTIHSPLLKSSQQSDLRNQIVATLRSRRRSDRAKNNLSTSSMISSVTLGSSIGSQLVVHELKPRLTSREVSIDLFQFVG